MIGRFAFHVSMTVITIAGFLMLIAAYWLYFPITPGTEYFNTPFPVANKTLHVGDVLRYEVEYCRNIDQPIQVTRELINDYVITLTPIVSRFPKGCGTVIVAREVIPEIVAPGKYYLLQTASYRVNPLRIENVTVRTETFEVIP